MNEIINFGNGDKVKVIMLKGEAGNDIQSVTKTSTSGLVDTYTITLTDGSTHTFEVTNGSSIDTIVKTGTDGLVDTYTITLTDGTTNTFTVTNGADGADGRGIVSIAKTSSSDLVDTYTITYTDGTTSTFTVTNGANVEAENLATIEPTNIATQSYSVGEYLVLINTLYKVTAAIAEGDTLAVGTNIEQTTVGSEIYNRTTLLGELIESGSSSYTYISGTVYTATKKCRVFFIIPSIDTAININASASGRAGTADSFLYCEDNRGIYLRNNNISYIDTFQKVLQYNCNIIGGNIVSFDLQEGDYVSMRYGNDSYVNTYYLAYNLI